MSAPLIWDPLVRIAHWALVLGVTLAWLSREGWGAWHERIGYVVLATVAVRLVWGWIGPSTARFSQFVRSPAETLLYARHVLRGDEPRHLGHNPLGGWMVLALLVNSAVVSLSGWLYTTDRYWGIEWVSDLHSRSADLYFVLVPLHLGGVLLASYRHRENLVGSMFHGRKRALEPGPVAGADQSGRLPD